MGLCPIEATILLTPSMSQTPPKVLEFGEPYGFGNQVNDGVLSINQEVLNFGFHSFGKNGLADLNKAPNIFQKHLLYKVLYLIQECIGFLSFLRRLDEQKLFFKFYPVCITKQESKGIFCLASGMALKTHGRDRLHTLSSGWGLTVASSLQTGVHALDSGSSDGQRFVGLRIPRNADPIISKR